MKNITIIILLFLSNIMFSQHICGTLHTVNSEIEKIVNRKSKSYKGDISKKSFCINIHFKIVRNTQGVGGVNPNSLQRIIDELNIYFNPHNIYFNSIGFEYIDNSRYVNVANDNEASELLKLNNRDDAINYYIVDTLWGSVAGRAFDIPSNSLVMNKSYLLSNISAHEVGHCLGLYHTFETQFCKEKIDGSNCHACGDKVCDTPADNRGGRNGDYNPDIRNLMSYYFFTADRFTQGQFNRMKHYILHTPLLQKVVSANCPYSNILEIQGSSVICDNTTQTYTIDNTDNSPIQWQLSNDIEEVSRTNNSITIKPKSGFNGLATLTASNGNSETTKTIWVGKPHFNIDFTSEQNYVHIHLQGNNLQHQGISNVKWEGISQPRTRNRCEGTLSGNGFTGRAHGNCFNWVVNAKVTATNICGTCVREQTITPNAVEPCDYTIRNNGSGYQTYHILPCDNNPRGFSTRSVNDTGITIQISNAMGQIVLTTKNKEFSLAHLLAGTYYARVIKNGQVVHTQTLLKQ